MKFLLLIILLIALSSFIQKKPDPAVVWVEVEHNPCEGWMPTMIEFWRSDPCGRLLESGPVVSGAYDPQRPFSLTESSWYFISIYNNHNQIGKVVGIVQGDSVKISFNTCPDQGAQ